jgi:hypothetical protein
VGRSESKPVQNAGEPLPGHDTPLGLSARDGDPTMWEPTELEGVFKSVDARDGVGIAADRLHSSST